MSASSSLEEDDTSLGIFTFKNNHKVLKLKVFSLKTHGYSGGRTCDDVNNLRPFITSLPFGL